MILYSFGNLSPKPLFLLKNKFSKQLFDLFTVKLQLLTTNFNEYIMIAKLSKEKYGN